MNIHHILVDIQQALKQIQEEPSKGIITDYKKQKQEGARLSLKGAIQRLLQETKENQEANSLAQRLALQPENKTVFDKLADIAAETPREENRTPRIPADIKDEITADINEAKKCMKTACYRSAVILCGRIMETALHRKYYEATGNDLLEKAPGTGLGTLIAKLSDQGVKLDPGLPNQIHLINQIRVYSVHTKKDTFSPSKTQAEAIMLYTMDILEKLFR